MDVALSRRAQELLAEQMARGHYRSAEEVIEDALTALLREEQAGWDDVDWDEVAHQVAAADEDLAAGRAVPGDEAFYERLRERARAKSNSL
jgi:Arc/MetJ-type ribon-helix-helix transcriptional regulator